MSGFIDLHIYSLGKRSLAHTPAMEVSIVANNSFVGEDIDLYNHITSYRLYRIVVLTVSLDDNDHKTMFSLV